MPECTRKQSDYADSVARGLKVMAQQIQIVHSQAIVANTKINRIIEDPELLADLWAGVDSWSDFSRQDFMDMKTWLNQFETGLANLLETLPDKFK